MFKENLIQHSLKLFTLLHTKHCNSLCKQFHTVYGTPNNGLYMSYKLEYILRMTQPTSKQYHCRHLSSLKNTPNLFGVSLCTKQQDDKLAHHTKKPNHLAWPSSGVSIHNDGSLMMPTLYEVDNAIRQIRQEHKKMRRLMNFLGILGVFIVIGMCAREADHLGWVILTKLGIQYCSPKTVHSIIMFLAKCNKLPSDTKIDDPYLKTTLSGLLFPNPIGLAAGYDISSINPTSFLKMGFGFIEIGTITPFPEDSVTNPQTIIAHPVQRALLYSSISSNNLGVQEVARNLKKMSKIRGKHDLTRLGILGVNIAHNTNSLNPLWDIGIGIRTLGPFADYIVLNLTSFQESNQHVIQQTVPSFKDIVDRAQFALTQLMNDVETQRQHTLTRLRTEAKIALPENDAEFNFVLPNLTGKRPPLFIKIDGHATDKELNDIANLVFEKKIHGLVISDSAPLYKIPNLFNAKESLVKDGRVSGMPLKHISTTCIYRLYQLTNGTVPIIAVGGIFTGSDALEKIEAGASAVQIFTALVLEGPKIVRQLKTELAEALYRKGYSQLSNAIGAAHKKNKN